jgi:MFS family permease
MAAVSMSNRRMLVSCFLGTTIEWYDFLVYGFLAPLAFNTLFFPSLSPLAGTIAAFGVFAVGFAARPLGGVFFAHFGDRVGRKPIMVSTLILMGASTTLMGLTPTFAQIGIVAPVVLVALRFLQGFSLGGESAAGPLRWCRAALPRARYSGRSRCLPWARCRESNCCPGAGGCRFCSAHRSS